MEWKKVKFLDYIKLNPSIKLNKGEVYPFVEMSNAPTNARIPDKNVYATYNGGGSKFEYNDTVVARIEPCLQNGKAFRCNVEKGFGSTEFLVFRPKNENIDSDYIYYLMHLEWIKDTMAATMVGASGRQRVQNSIFNSIEISLPPLPYQRRISSILSDYDSLIENYQRQISLLEESAKHIYKEWFVDFKFPGVEMAENGLPKGWQKKKLGEICEIKSGFAFKSEWWTTDGYPVLKIKDIDNNTIDCSNLDFVAKDKVEKVKLFKLSEGDLVIAMTGATIGKIGIVPKIDNLYTNQRVGKFFLGECPFDKLPFVFCFFIKEETQKQIISLSSSSSAQPNISGDQLMGLTENYSFEMVDKFNNDMKPLFIKICNLRTQIRLLRQNRDILLPRLMNGEIEVEE